MNDAVVAIDIGGTSTKVALVSAPGVVSHWRSFPTKGPVQAFRERLLQAVHSVSEEAGRSRGIACGVAGFVHADGTLLYNGNLSWLEGAPVGAWLRETGGPVVVESDANTACAGEYFYGSRGGTNQSERLLCVAVGTGVGVGAMVDGQIQRTAFGCLGDAGHVIVLPEGPACTCGGRGCAEAVVSTEVLGRAYGGLGFRALVADVTAGLPVALQMVEEAGSALGIAIASLANIFVPEEVAIAGGLASLGEPLLRSVNASFRRHAGDFIRRRAAVTLACTGSHATLLGAAACFFAETGGGELARASREAGVT